jgi:Tfp pilus assembly protein PilZ
MTTSEQQGGRYTVTARLFSLIGSLPRDQQLILLKQLVGDTVTAQLFKLIVEMSEDQQLILLEQLGHSLDSEPEERTVSLEGTEPSMRENPRKSCLINANYRIKGSNFRSYILDISIGGVFIETNERFSVGETVILNFNLPENSQSVSAPGKIAWSGPQGFGVKFEGLEQPQGHAIKQFVEKKD